MDFRPDPTLSAEETAQLTSNARNHRADQFSVRQVELYHDAAGQVNCLLEAPGEEAVRQHHAALHVNCGEVHRVDGVT